jgi:predicted unusual protein kinase regulating ubiquinone biosynthesis (AarF/ABC1/UbiB family)
MGFKASMIIVKNPSKTVSDEELLQQLGFATISFSGEDFFETCMHPRDNSINIGNYNDCLIITDDFQLTTALDLTNIPQSLSDYEKVLTKLYPDTEVLTVACHSVTNYHLYSLVKNEQKLRFKKVLSDEPLLEYGDRIEEEESIYAYSKIIDGQRLFRSMYRNKDVYEYEEDQMMEAFAFGVAKRHLGVVISMGEDDELMFETPFRKYAVSK